MVVSEAATNDGPRFIECVEIKRRKSRSNDGRNCEERDGGNNEDRGIRRWWLIPTKSSEPESTFHRQSGTLQQKKQAQVVLSRAFAKY